MLTASRLCSGVPLSPRRPTGLRLLCAWIGLAASLFGCSDAPDPLRREPVILIEGEALGRLLDRAIRLEDTPIGRAALDLRTRLADCPTAWGHLASGAEDEPDAEQARERAPLDRLRCLDPHDADPLSRALAAFAREQRGDHAGWIQWPIGDHGRLELSIDVDEDDDLSLSGWIDPPEDLGALALLLPGHEPPAAPAIEPSQTLFHARMRPAGGFRISSLIPSGSQADRLFALKSRLLEGALLTGSWEIAFMPPAPDGGLPLAVGAVHHRLEAAIRQAVDEALDQLERTWPIRRTPRRFAAAGIGTLDGGCFLELPLLPELAPCWVVTPEALLVGYRAEALEAALAPPNVASGPKDPSPPIRHDVDGDSVDGWSQTGLEIHFDRMRIVDRQLSPNASGTRPSDLWSRFELRLEAIERGRISLRARLEARS